MNHDQRTPDHAKREGSCARCKGLMVPSYTDAVAMEAANRFPASAWRCVNCGDWVDATIIKNREHVGNSDAASPTGLLRYNRRRWRW